MVEIEVANRSGVEVEADAAAELARRVLAGEGIDDGELGIAFVGPDESRALKREHLGIDEATDVLSFPIDGRDAAARGRAAAARRRRPLPAGRRRRLARGRSRTGCCTCSGYDHGAEMERREEAYAA